MVNSPARGSSIGGAAWALEEVQLTLGGRRIIAGFCASAEAGTSTVLVGPSGCGKTTLLRLLGGLVNADAGRVVHRARDGRTLAATELRASFCFQEPRLLPWLSALDNAALPLSLAGVTKTDARAAAENELRRTGLADSRHLLPRQLSGGMQMRVALARALVTHPDLLLLDEPFAALDELRRMQLDEALCALHGASGFSMIFVTHSAAEAAFTGDRVLVLGAGGRGIVRDLVMSKGPRTDAHRATEAFAHDLARIQQALCEAAEAR